MAFRKDSGDDGPAHHLLLGEGEAASAPLVADFFDCGYLVRTMLTSFLSASWHLFVSRESFPQDLQLLLIPISMHLPGTHKGINWALTFVIHTLEFGQVGGTTRLTHLIEAGFCW